MRYVMMAVSCYLLVGCAYGPAHLDAFYSQRNRYQDLIDDIEKRYSLTSRDTDKGQTAVLKQEVAGLKKENEILAARLQVFEDQWFRSLGPELQLKWRLESGHRPEGPGKSAAPPGVPGPAGNP